MEFRNPLIVAIDRSSPDEIEALAKALGEVAGCLKIGLQAFVANGPSVVRSVIDSGSRVFLDLKIHDIPNTARHAVSEASRLGAAIVTVHATGGPDMLAAAAEAAGDDILVAAVTVLTSLDEAMLEKIGIRGGAESAVLRLAGIAMDSGIRSVVASPLEIAPLRQEFGRDLVIITPGIRSEQDHAGDQRRTMTPRNAIAAGANLIVVGRPITAAPDPRAAALAILDEIGRA